MISPSQSQDANRFAALWSYSSPHAYLAGIVFPLSSRSVLCFFFQLVFVALSFRDVSGFVLCIFHGNGWNAPFSLPKNARSVDIYLFWERRFSGTFVYAQLQLFEIVSAELLCVYPNWCGFKKKTAIDNLFQWYQITLLFPFLFAGWFLVLAFFFSILFHAVWFADNEITIH